MIDNGVEVNMKLAQIQVKTYRDQRETVNELEYLFSKACKSNVDMVFVGEMFGCPYRTDLFSEYAEYEGDGLYKICSELSRKNHVYFSAGTVPEIDGGGKLYNTAYIFGRDGEQIAKYRKMHLFDVNIPGKIAFRESEFITAGNEIVVFDTEFGKMGVSICFDIRFPELAKKMRQKGAKLIVCPASFNKTTGPMHWEILFRARAIDSQCFYVGTGNAYCSNSQYDSYGHSIVVSPWGKIINQMNDKSGIIISEIDFNEVNIARESIPLFSC